MQNYRVLSFRSVVLVLGYFLTTACASFATRGEIGDRAGSSSAQHPSHLRCLAQAIHGEARGETEEGKLLVGRVIATRVQYGYGKNYCDVVHAPRQFAPKKLYTEASMKAARKSHEMGPNGITHFHSYPSKITKKARFTTSPQCKYRGKVGGHWTFACHERRMMSSITSDDD